MDVHDPRRRQVGDRRPDHRRGGRLRHLPLDGRQDVPERCRVSYYSNPYFLGGDKYKGPYTEDDSAANREKQDAVSVDGNDITVKMSKPFQDFPYYAAFPARARSRSVPRSRTRRSTPATRWSTGPYKIEEYTSAKSLILVRNDQWDPATDPARTQYPDGYVFKAGHAVRPDRPDPAGRLAARARPR